MYFPLQVPRLGGIKKGWARLFVVVCDFKLFLFDIPPDRAIPSPVVQQVLDMRWAVTCNICVYFSDLSSVGVDRATANVR